jgi:hypothetical protein
MAKARKKVDHPWVAIAVFCESFLEEKDDVLSAIRIVDTFTIQRPPGWDESQPVPIAVNCLVGFKSGDVRGDKKLRIYIVSPSNRRKKAYEKTVTFLGGNSGVNLKIRMGLHAKATGMYWIEVYVEKWLATRIPLTIRLEEPEEPSGESPPGGG